MKFIESCLFVASKYGSPMEYPSGIQPGINTAQSDCAENRSSISAGMKAGNGDRVSTGREVSEVSGVIVVGAGRLAVTGLVFGLGLVNQIKPISRLVNVITINGSLFFISGSTSSNHPIAEL
jgi:hypothetical protein